jgi:hypothetical protein
VPIDLRSGGLKLLEPSGPVQVCNGIAFALVYLRKKVSGVITYFIGKYYDCSIDQTTDLSKVSLLHVVFRDHCPLHKVFLTVRIVGHTGTKCGEIQVLGLCIM